MKRIITTLALAAALATAWGIAAAQKDPPSPPEGDHDWAGAPPMHGRGPEGMHGMGRGQMGMHGGMGMGFFMGPERLLLLDGGSRVAESLDLTGTQRDKLRSIGSDLARKGIRMRADLETAQLDFHDLMRGDSPSRSELDSKIDALTRIRGEMMKAGATATLDARKVLTSEQRKKLEEMRPGRGGRESRRGSHQNMHKDMH
jgi:Spy/CpxP family protein refolding chaperone